MTRLNRFFHLSERGTSIATELRAGIVTFLTMSYILFVNPQILSQAGLPASDVAVATAIAAAFATLVMGLYANFPFALAPGMGLNAYFTFGVVGAMGVNWQLALTAVFVEGVIFLGLSLGGLRSALMSAIPATIKIATMSGIGLFLAIIGFQNAGLVVDHPMTLVTLGRVGSFPVLLSLLGLLLTAAMLALGFRAAILAGILGVTAVAWISGSAPAPSEVFSIPDWPSETFLALEFHQILSTRMLTIVLAFLFVDIFDTAGTLIGVGKLGGFFDEKGELPGSEKAFTADALGTIAGATLGTSTVTTYVESATGVQEGGRTGLTAVTVSFLFLLALFFTPLLTAVPALATAPALIVVGAMMMQGARQVDWDHYEESIPAFLTIAAMPFTYSIANGISFGIISFTAIKLLTGKWRQVHPIMWVLSALLVVFYSFS